MRPSRLLALLSRDYPWQLRALPDPPEIVSVRGETAGAPAIAVVGTREPSAGALRYASDLASRLARAGAVVWSGGAVGIDAAAHRGAMAGGGRTVVVMGTGEEHCFPPEHGPLYGQIEQSGGGLVYPFPAEQPPTTWTFLRRNGVLAALTDAVVVVEAPIRSGARSTASWARRLGRPLFVVPVSPWDSRGAGNLAELGAGARPLVSPELLAAELGLRLPPEPVTARPRKRPHESPSLPWPSSPDACTEPPRYATPQEPPSPAGRAVLGVMSPTPQYFDAICERSGLPAALVQQVLLTLTLQAVLVEGPSGAYRLVSS